MLAEKAVRDRGFLYLYAGLNKGERTATDREGAVTYESVHRRALSMAFEVIEGLERKVVFLTGHSGYERRHAGQALEVISRLAPSLDRLLTGVIRGWENPMIRGRLTDGRDLVASDHRPALAALLRGGAFEDCDDFRREHLKVVILAQGAWKGS